MLVKSNNKISLDLEREKRITSIKLNEVSNQLVRLEKAKTSNDSHMTTMMKTDDGQNENPSSNRTLGSP